MTSLIDFHIHSTASDGTLSPAEVVSLALNSGLKAIALTDHDTVEGNEEAIKEGRRLGFEVVPGVEISCGHAVGEVHLLGFFIDWKSDLLKQKLSMLREFREKRNPQIIDKLRHLGLNITYDEVKMVAEGGSIGRPHIAQVLKEKGFVFSNQDAFDRYLKKGGSAYVPKELLSVMEAVNIIHDAGGLAIIAHPMQSRSISTYGIRRFIRELMDDGIDGLEVYYSSHSSNDIGILLEIADEYDLLVTGGTDFHGEVKPGIEIGIGMGDMKIPYKLLSIMKEKLGKKEKKD